MVHPSEYSVGWICALQSEYIAAQTVLDDEHDGVEEVSTNDNNDYTLGRIGKHNVVIAVLPIGEFGTTSTASVARDMCHTFPNIRIGLMVGIGGGVPSAKHDVRLGDIVVSAPGNGEGGVFQYDFGHKQQNQPLRHTGFLNQPPPLVRTAVNGLAAQHKRKGNRIDETISELLRQNPRLQKEFGRPDPDTDRLYQPHVIHPEDIAGLCDEICSQDLNDWVSRVERGSNEDDPAIHYGLIASGNQVIKDASIREDLSKRMDVLCFEMEAAGLMNHFPCLVVRGICDYADSHKNYVWQGYAAMAAAAYTKELLLRIAPNKVEAEKKLGEVMLSVEQGMNTVNTNLENLSNSYKQDKLYQWLETPDASVSYHEGLQHRIPGSGSWFIKRDDFTEWKSRESSFLWLFGIPGCGKTFLSCAIIEHLAQDTSPQPLLYFFFTFADASKQKISDMIRSLIAQLLSSCSDTRKYVDELFVSCGNGNRQPSLEDLIACFLKMAEQTGELLIILDALDECTTRKGDPIHGLLSWIQSLLSNRNLNVHILVTSRPEYDILAALSKISRLEDRIPVQSIMVSDDISTYIQKRVHDSEEFKRWRLHPHIQSLVEDTLVRKADGMFRWVACQLDILEDCLDKSQLIEALETLPKDLDDTYARIIANIPDTYRPNAIRILQFLTYSERPLQIVEAVDALVVNLDAHPMVDLENRMPDLHEIGMYCSSLVTISDKKYSLNNDVAGNAYGSKVLQLAHFSVKEYLVSSRVSKSLEQHFEESSARTSIATVCVAYLLYIEEELTASQIEKSYPFADYCARYWMPHAATRKEDNQLLHELIMTFFASGNEAYRNWLKLFDPGWPSGTNHQYPEHPAPELYYASSWGLQYEVDALLAQGVNVNAKYGAKGTALQAASQEGFCEIVQLLLDHDADVNAEDGSFNTALIVASRNGHREIVQLLLNNGADINMRSGLYSGNALHAASEFDRLEIVQLLLDNGADVDGKSGLGWTSLCIASLNGHQEIVQLLVDHGADVNTEDDIFGNTALYVASEQGHREIVQLLLDNSEDANARTKFGWTALYVASLRGHQEIVQLLLDNGADVDVKFEDGWTPLHIACQQGHREIVQLLLDKGADVNAGVNEFKETALYMASQNGHQKVVQLLLHNGADVDAKCALDWDIVQQLLDNGAVDNTQTGNYVNALYAASQRGHRKVVQLLLNNGADVRPAGALYGCTAIYAASQHGHQEIVQLLESHEKRLNRVKRVKRNVTTKKSRRASRQSDRID